MYIRFLAYKTRHRPLFGYTAPSHTPWRDTRFDTHTRMHAVLRVTLAAVIMGWCASLLIDFFDRYAEHRHRYDQYALLAASQLCRDSAERVATSEVNNCATAQRHAEGEALSPLAAAGLETLADLAVCGRQGGRCEPVFGAIAQSSTVVVALTTALGCTAAW